MRCLRVRLKASGINNEILSLPSGINNEILSLPSGINRHFVSFLPLIYACFGVGFLIF